LVALKGRMMSDFNKVLGEANRTIEDTLRRSDTYPAYNLNDGPHEVLAKKQRPDSRRVQTENADFIFVVVARADRRARR
jgi:hypothetical protein